MSKDRTENTKKSTIPSAKSDDQPATRGMLHLVQNEIRSDIQALDLKIDARFNRMEARFSGHDGQFKSIDSRFKSLEAGISELLFVVKKMDAKMDRMELKHELQEANNRIVLEGHQLLWQKVEELEIHTGLKK